MDGRIINASISAKIDHDSKDVMNDLLFHKMI